MTDAPGGRRRASVHITRQRASRLYRLVRLLDDRPQTRDEVLKALAIGLRTFYRELDLLKKCGLKVHHKEKVYTLAGGGSHAEGRLPFPDPQLNFDEMAQLARCDSAAGRRLAALLAAVIGEAVDAPRRSRRR